MSYIHMIALSFKLPESIVESLREFSKKKNTSQTKIIEESLVSWIEKEKIRDIEDQFATYNAAMDNNPEYKEEELFLANSTLSDSLSFLKKEHV